MLFQFSATLNIIIICKNEDNYKYYEDYTTNSTTTTVIFISSQSQTQITIANCNHMWNCMDLVATLSTTMDLFVTQMQQREKEVPELCCSGQKVPSHDARRR